MKWTYEQIVKLETLIKQIERGLLTQEEALIAIIDITQS